jgi:hypothetical protein
MIEGWFYGHGSADGWWYCPYGCEDGGAVGLSQETILRNLMGLKSVVGSLLETRSAGGATRPAETGNPQANRRRKTYSALYTYQQFLDYYRANQAAIADAIKQSQAFQKRNVGRIVFRGSYDIPAFAAPHPGEFPPPEEPPSAVLDPPPCGYLLTAAQMQGSGEQPGSRSVADRLEAHGLKIQRRGHERFFVPMKQEQRGLVPLLLDDAAEEEMVDAERVSC